METLAKEAEDSALIQIEKDQAAALKHKLPDFWLPSLTPTYTSNGPPQSLMDVKLQTTCRGGNPPHPLSSVLMLYKSNASALISHYY
jgi:nitric oxide synthase-interacting protein